MNKSEMTDYMREEMWAERVEETISHWEMIQGVQVPDEIKDNVVNYMRVRIKKGIKKNTLTKLFMQVAVTALLYIKVKGINK